MGQRSQHVLIVDDDLLYQPIYEMLMQHLGRWPTFAQNGDEALAILRSTLHPLIVTIRGSMRVDGGGYGSLALSLLANRDYAVMHAFIVGTNRRHDSPDDVDALREEIARLNVGFVAWLETPPGLEAAVAALDNAEEYLSPHG